MSDDLIKRSEPTIEPKQCEKIIKAIDAIDDFLIKYSEFWNDITWRSNIDGHELYVDWGYFEEGMREIKNYCKQLNGQK